jgi:mRNA interferase MazF
MVSRGDIWLAQLGAAGEDGSNEAQPCLVVSPPEIHDHLAIVTVAPIADAGRPAGFRVPVELGGRAGAIRLEQIHTIDKRRLTRQVGAADRKTLAAALVTLREMFAE